MEIAPHFDPHTPHVPDAIERRSTRPTPPVTAVAMAAVLAMMFALIACRIAFTGAEADEILSMVMLGIVAPLIAIVTMWHCTTVAAKQRRWAAAQHAAREAAEAELREGQTRIMETLARMEAGTLTAAVAQDIGLLRAQMALLRTDHDEVSEEVGRIRRSVGISI